MQKVTVFLFYLLFGNQVRLNLRNTCYNFLSEIRRWSWRFIHFRNFLVKHVLSDMNVNWRGTILLQILLVNNNGEALPKSCTKMRLLHYFSLFIVISNSEHHLQSTITLFGGVLITLAFIFKTFSNPKKKSSSFWKFFSCWIRIWKLFFPSTSRFP